jgi:hypothetical protein
MEHGEKRPWCWNAVQGGDVHNNPGRIDNIEISEDAISITTTPRHWVTGRLLEEARMKQIVHLDNSVVHMRFEFQYNGSDAHVARHQEMPAVFLWHELDTMFFFGGSNPWTFDRQGVKRVRPPLRPNPVPDEAHATERWAAYVNKDYFGVGVHFPYTESFVYYRVYDESQPYEANCSYLAPVQTRELQPHSTSTYDMYLSVGWLDDIRKQIYSVHA